MEHSICFSFVFNPYFFHKLLFVYVFVFIFVLEVVESYSSLGFIKLDIW